MLSVEINEMGDVEDISIAIPAGAGFDEAAVEAVSHWKYRPMLIDVKPVRVLTVITVNNESRTK